MPPSTRNAARVVAEACGEATYTTILATLFGRAHPPNDGRWVGGLDEGLRDPFDRLTGVLRLSMTTVALQAARPCAIARPIPPVEPVTIAILPERSIFKYEPPGYCAASKTAVSGRGGGAMNSGPTGSAIVSRKMRSISARAAVSSDHPKTSSIDCNCPGWRAPHNPVAPPSSTTQPTPNWMTH